MKASLYHLEIIHMVGETVDSINCGYSRTHLTPIIQMSEGKVFKTIFSGFLLAHSKCCWMIIYKLKGNKK